MSQQTVTINGVIYDAQTGLPLAKATMTPAATPHATTTPTVAPKATTRPQHSQTIHRTTQKSATLNRAIVKKATPPAHQIRKQPAQRTQPSIQKSPAITRFAPHPTGAKKPVRSMDIGPVSHPMVARAQQKAKPTTPPKATIAPVAPKATPTPQQMPKPSQMIKQQAIDEALAKAPHHNAKNKTAKHPRKRSRMFSIASASLALMMLAGYFTYLNLPNLSVRVAAAQAGFDATYPGYHPDGYSLKGRVAYDEGQVSMQFAANGGPQTFTVNQEKSSWDSSALLANYVEPKSNGGYVPHSEKGLTIYVFDGNAAWVNGGIRYTIEGNAPLSSDQILDIATSM